MKEELSINRVVYEKTVLEYFRQSLSIKIFVSKRKEPHYYDAEKRYN